jgi:signal peptidase II
MPETGWRSVQALWGYGIAVVTLGLDQWTKWLAQTYLRPYEAQTVTPWFDWLLAYNSGAAFSFLAGAGGWQRWFFVAIAVAVSAVLALWLSRLPRERLWLGVALGLVLGGGLGNLYDRLVFGHVVDFISLHYAGWHWPTFNIADSAITLGAAVLILDSFRGQSRQGSTA